MAPWPWPCMLDWVYKAAWSTVLAHRALRGSAGLQSPSPMGGDSMGPGAQSQCTGPGRGSTGPQGQILAQGGGACCHSTESDPTHRPALYHFSGRQSQNGEHHYCKGSGGQDPNGTSCVHIESLYEFPVS